MSLRRFSVRHARSFEAVWAALERLLPKLRPLAQSLGRDRAERVLRPLERSLKGLLFDCHMCGQCALSVSGMACPMNCPKHDRNGPCGGVRANGGCEVRPDMRCVWLEALDGASRMRNAAALSQPQPPVDHSREDTSAWLRSILQSAPIAEELPAPAAPRSALARALESGRFVVTAELTPPDAADGEDLLERAAHLRGVVDAINLTDGPGAHCHMSSLAAAALLVAKGYEPVFQISCRDRNRIAMQADILGAAALGARNLLCITGDHTAIGDHPQAKPVFDLDAVSLLQIARRMRDAGTYASGRKLSAAPQLYLGATINPFAPPFEARIANLERKVAAGAQFIQTQYCLDVPRLEAFLAEVRRRGLEGRFHLIVGTGPLLSAKGARWLATHVPGMHVPEALIRRLERAADPRHEGVRACVETVQQLAELQGVAGVHLMAHRREPLIAEIIDRAGLRRSHEGKRTALA